MTAYTTGGDNIEMMLERLSHVFDASFLTEELLLEAKNLIIKQTLDIAPLTTRRMKLLYKHVAFGADMVCTTEEYLDYIRGYSLDDVRDFGDTYYTALNAVLIVVGGNQILDKVGEWSEKYFGHVKSGSKRNDVVENIYTGGFGYIKVEDKTTRLMFGWDMKHMNVDDSPALNVMMSMFLRRLERAYADAGMDDVYVELKVAGYYGLRTMRVFVTSPTKSAEELTEVVVKALNRICDTEASISRLERSRNAAMVEKLDKWEKSDDTALEIAWQMTGRGCMYDAANRINYICEISASDVMRIAQRLFRRYRPTYIVASNDSVNDNAYCSLLTDVGLSCLIEENDVKPTGF